jgi:hypothetical protein
VSVIAYRAWVVSEAGVLSAVAADLPWPQEQITAVCAAGSTARYHLPPNPGCRCGIYAWSRPLDPEMPTWWVQRRTDGRVAVGVVRLWGRMCGGEAMTGVRSQHARVVALVGDTSDLLDWRLYPTVRRYPSVSTMYGDWDVHREQGFAVDAKVRADRERATRRRAGTDLCVACGAPACEDGIVYEGHNPWLGGQVVAPVRACRVCPRPTDTQRSAARFDREWAYANRAPRLRVA